MQPNISVVIPLFNKQTSIHRTIASVLNQTYPHFELMVVNDGSTDNSLNVVNEFADSRIHVITQPNAGESGARNRGIFEAKCPVVAFLDADDEWLPGFLEKIVHLRESFPDCRVYATAFRKVSDNPSKYIEKKNPFPPDWEGILKDYYTVLTTYTPFCASSIAVDKDILMRYKGFREGIVLRGDMELWVRLSMSVKFAYSNAILSLYHLDAENRVCEVFQDRDLILGGHWVTLDNCLQEKKVPAELRSGAKNYLTLSLFDYVSRNILHGDRRYALKLLFKWRFSQPYFRRWLRLFYYCVRL